MDGTEWASQVPPNVVFFQFPLQLAFDNLLSLKLPFTPNLHSYAKRSCKAMVLELILDEMSFAICPVSKLSIRYIQY